MGALKISVDNLRLDLIQGFKITPDNIIELQKEIGLDELQKEQQRGNLLHPFMAINEKVGPISNLNKVGQRLTFFEKKSMVELITDVFNKAQDISPVDGGDYKKNFKILDTDSGQVYNGPEEIPSTTKEVFVFNDSDYARKIEVGVIKRRRDRRVRLTVKRRRGRPMVSYATRPFSAKAPQGVLKSLPKVFRKAYPDYRYGITFNFLSIPGHGIPYGKNDAVPGVFVKLRDL